MAILDWLKSHPEFTTLVIYPVVIAGLSLIKHKFEAKWPRLTAILMASGPDLRALLAALKLPAPPQVPPP
jgi:hypothetical protein